MSISVTYEEQLDMDIAVHMAEAQAARNSYESALCGAETARAALEADKSRLSSTERLELTKTFYVHTAEKKLFKDDCEYHEKVVKELEEEGQEWQLSLGKRKRAEDRHVEDEQRIPKSSKVAGSTGQSSLAYWRFADLPCARDTCKLPAELPQRLRKLLHLEPAPLKQLTLVKLKLIARAYLERYPTDGHSEDELCKLMQSAIQAVVQDWGRATPTLPEMPDGAIAAHWKYAVASCVRHWLEGWTCGQTGRAINVCCQETGVNNTALLQALSNPPESLIDTYVNVALTPARGIELDALMTLLCARMILVHVPDMPHDAQSLEEATVQALAAAAFKLSGIRPEPLQHLCAQRSTSFSRMLSSIQRQLAVPLFVIFDDIQMLNSSVYNHLFAPELGTTSRGTPPEDLALKLKVFLDGVKAPLFGGPHFFYGALGQSWDLRPFSSPWPPLPGSLTPYSAYVRSNPLCPQSLCPNVQEACSNGFPHLPNQWCPHREASSLLCAR